MGLLANTLERSLDASVGELRPADCYMAESQPQEHVKECPCASSGQSNNDSVEVVQLPSLLPAALEVAAAESDNDDCVELDGPCKKYRKLCCSEPPPEAAAALSAELLTALEARQTLFLGKGKSNIEEFARSVIAAEAIDDNFYIYDLAMVQRLYIAWCEAMPRVHPCYAVKCNPDDGMLAVLAAMGAGFDCASEAEIEKVLALGASPDRIVYAHPCKPPKQIRFAAGHGINLTTFDTESELHKMAEYHPSSGLLLRIRADDPNARCQLGNKYGAEMADVPLLLALAKELRLHVRGVSFHVGSGAKNPLAFMQAIEAARKVFDIGLAMGFEMEILDIGGGFCGGNFDASGNVDLGGVPAAVNEALDRLFPDDGKLRVIAEPGRYFAEATGTYLCYINGWRQRTLEGEALPAIDYYITDGLYGSMNCLVYDHAELLPKGVRSPLLPTIVEDGVKYKSTLFGPTCDGLDTICRDMPMPRLRNGDFVMFPRFGAYTLAGAVNFNGFDVCGAKVFYVYTSAN